MNNILTFEDYKKMNIRQVESVIYRQFIEEDIKDEEIVNEGLIRKAINKAASKFIQNALADEIEKGKELEKRIKEALDGLDKGFDDIKQKINANQQGVDPKSKLAALEQVKEAIKAVQSQTFDTLTMIGSAGEIDFGGFLGSSTVITAAHFGVLFSPVSAIFMTRKAYKYFLGIIKQTIRRNLLIIQLNFDQFENLILQKSFEAEDDGEMFTRIDTLNDVINKIQAELCNKDTSLLGQTNGKKLKAYLDNLNATQKLAIKQNDVMRKNNPFSSLWADQHNNTYTRTLEQIKQYINDDSQKELDSLKNSIQKMAGNDPDLIPFGELMICAAEEYAIHTNHGINNNFIKMSSVFNLENQKKLIDLIKKTQEEHAKEVKEKKAQVDAEKINTDLKNKAKKGKRLYNQKIKGKEDTYTFDKFKEEFDDNDISCLKAYFVNRNGENIYKELIKKYPLYKYLIDIDTSALNKLYEAMKVLKFVEVSKLSDFYDNIVKKEHTLYSSMSEKSIQDAVLSRNSENYFGFYIDDDDVDSDNTLTDKSITDKSSRLLGYAIMPHKNDKKRYFLTIENDGQNIFDILHKDFNTEIFKDDKKYQGEISSENKKDILKIIHKNLKIGNSVINTLSEYLVRLEAHMLLNKKDDWFVIKNQDDIVNLDCFNTDSDVIVNDNAYVEINQSDYEYIKRFISSIKSLADNDFDISSETNNKKEDETK